MKTKIKPHNDHVHFDVDRTYGLSVLEDERATPYLNARVHMSDGDTYLNEGAARRLRVLWRVILFGESFPEVVNVLKD